MDKKKLTDFYAKYRMFIFIGTTAVSSLILVFLVIYPQIQKLISNQNAYNEIVNKVDFLETKADELNNLDENRIKDQLEIAQLALPQEKNYTDVIGIVQNIVAKNSYILTSLNFTQDRETEKNEFEVRISVSGIQSGLTTLIGDLEESYRPMKLTGIEASTTASDASEATLSFAVFFEQRPASLGGVDAPLPKLSEKEESDLAKIDQERVELSREVGESFVFSPRGKQNPFE